MKEDSNATVSTLQARIKQLEAALEESELRIKSERKVTLEAYEYVQTVNDQNKIISARNKELAARNKALEDPEGRIESKGLGWLSKVVQVIRRTGRPLRSLEIMHELSEMDVEGGFKKIANPNTYLSVVLTKGVKAKRLKIHKVPGTRGGYYALEEWMDKDGKLSEEMKKQLL